MSDKYDIEALARRKFEGLPKNDLLEIATILGHNFPRQTSEKTIRLKLCEVMGQNVEAEKEVPPAVVPIAKKNGAFDPKPDLKNIHNWGGKVHRVKIHKPEQSDDSPQKYCRLYWEGEKRDYAFGVECHLPHPLYESLKNAEKRPIEQEEIKDSKGVLLGIENIETVRPRYNFNYLGLKPGTEDLPESTLDYWQRQARKTENFKGQPRRVLIGIRSDLYGPAPNGLQFYKDLTDEDILDSVLTFLWGDKIEDSLAA